MTALVWHAMSRERLNRTLLRQTGRSGIAFVGIGLGMIYAGFDQGNRLDWLNSGVVSGLFASGGLLVIALIATELAAEHPLIRLRVAKRNVWDRKLPPDGSERSASRGIHVCLAPLELASIDRQLSQALAGCRKDRVDDCGDDGRGPGFAHTDRRPEALHDVDLNARCLIHAQNLVSVEIGLLDTAVLQRDLAIKRSRDAEDERALDLSPDGIRVDDGAAIDRADDPPHTNRAILRHLDFGNPAP